jgi:polar amino acid transport system substrate-binding protein
VIKRFLAARPPSRLLALSLVSVTCVALAACSSSGSKDSKGSKGSASSSSASTSGANGSLFSMLPESMQSKKELIVGTDASSASVMEVTQSGGTIVGFDPDLINAAAALLGIKVTMVGGTFDGLIAGVTSGRYDVAMAGIGDLKKREAQVDFVDYLKAGTALLVKKGNPKGLTTYKELCGHSVAYETGTFEDSQLQTESTACTSAGKPKISLQAFEGSSSALLAVQSGRADALYDDNTSVSYMIKQSPSNFEQVGPSDIIAYVGIALPKTQTQLRDALQAALQKLIDNGTYTDLVKKWGLTTTAVPKILINTALL